MVKNFIKILNSNILVAFIKFLMLYSIILLGTPEDVGVYSYSLAIVSPIFLFSSLKLRSIIVTEGETYKNDEYLVSVITFSLITLALVILVVPLIEGSTNVITIVIVLGIQKLVENIKYFYHGIFTRRGDLDKLAQSQNYSYIISFLVFLMMYYFSLNLILSLLLYVLAYGLTIFFEITILSKIEKVYTGKWKLPNILKIFMISLPLSYSSFIGSLTIQFPRYVIKSYYDLALLGVFSSLSYILVIINLLSNSLAQVFLPKLKENLMKNKEKFNKLVLLLCAMGASIGILFILITIFIGQFLIDVVFGELYAEYSFVLVLLSISITFQLTGVFIGTSLTVLKIYNIHSIIYSINFLITCVSSFLLIPRYGIEGAAMSLIIGNVIILLLFIGIYIFIVKNKIGKEEEND